jgi:hypothetical protein
MKNVIFPSILALTLIACASNDQATSDTTATIPPAEVSKPIETIPISPFHAETLYQEGKYADAFNMEYLLAIRGDDRSQFNVGISYYFGIEGELKPDRIEALAWMLTSESTRTDSHRAESVIELSEQLNNYQQKKAAQRSASLLTQYKSGIRMAEGLQFVDSEDSEVVIVEPVFVLREPEPCSGVGTRIRRTCSGSKTFNTTQDFMKSPIVR